MTLVTALDFAPSLYHSNRSDGAVEASESWLRDRDGFEKA